MGRFPSVVLWLRIASARLRGAGAAAQSSVTAVRPAGQLIWIVADPAPDAIQGLTLVLRRLMRQRPAVTVLVSAPPDAAEALPEGVLRIDPFDDVPAAADLLLGHWRPDLVVLTGALLPAALIARAQLRRIPVMAADAVARAGAGGGFLRRRLARALIARLSRISVRDAESLSALTRLGADPARLEVGGLLSDPPEPLHCSEAERASIAAITRTRPVWLAAAVPGGEVPQVLAAHDHAQRHAHRMLLILAPDQPDQIAGLVDDLTAQGWLVARRTVEGEPDDETQIFFADDPGEYGLWYRLAPVTYMGGTLIGGAGHARTPLEAAALGSAILHGPQTAPFAGEYARLDDARAARVVTDEQSLGDAVADLMAPDRAAMLAHNAWVVTSGGAGAAEAVALAILSELDAHPALEHVS